MDKASRNTNHDIHHGTVAIFTIGIQHCRRMSREHGCVSKSEDEGDHLGNFVWYLVYNDFLKGSFGHVLFLIQVVGLVHVNRSNHTGETADPYTHNPSE